MLDPSFSPEEARSLFVTLLRVQYASLAVVLLGLPIAVWQAWRYYRHFSATDRPIYRVMVTNILFSGLLYTCVLLAQTIVLARSADSDINSFPVAYSWLVFVNRIVMSGVAGIAEPFFLWRATKATPSKLFKWIGLAWLIVTTLTFLASHALIVREVVVDGQPWSFEISIVECAAYWLVVFLVGAPGVVLMRELVRARSIVMRPSQDRLLHWYQAAIKTSLIGLIPGIGGAISSCFFSRRAPNFEHYFFFNLYLPIGVISTLYALTSREDPRKRPGASTNSAGSAAMPSFVMHLPPATTGLRQDCWEEQGDDTRISVMVERGAVKKDVGREV